MSAEVQSEKHSTETPATIARSDDQTRHSFVGPVVCSVLLLSLLVVFRSLGIPLRPEGTPLLGLYLAIGVQSVAYAVLLVAVQFPRELFLPAVLRIFRRPEFILLASVLGFLFFRLLPTEFAFSLVVTILALTQIQWTKLASTIVPGVYLFIGLFTVFGYNIVAVTVRFKPDYDSILRRADAFFLFGHSVSELSHRFAAAVPGFVTEGLLTWYALMFAQVGAALLLCAILVNRGYAMRFVSTILLVYAITITFFFAFPTHSPYFTCLDHTSSHLPLHLIKIQEQFVRGATARWKGGRAPLGPEYYVAFPCMHIAQPLIVMWFLRRWRRIVRVLVCVDVVLAFAIVILEWHYFVGVLGGALISAVAIWIEDRWGNRLVSQQVA